MKKDDLPKQNTEQDLAKNQNAVTRNAIDVLRIIAMLMVVNLHTVLNFVERQDFFATKAWFVFGTITMISKAGIIIFFALSGYLVLNKQKSIQENWQKTLNRLIVPYIFFEIINIIFARISTDESGLSFVTQQLTRLINHPSSALWFLISLIGLYLLNPLWYLLFDQASKKPIARYVTFFFLGLAVIIALTAPFTTQSLYGSINSWLVFAGIYLFGGLLAQNWIKPLKQKTAIITAIISFIILFVTQYLIYLYTYQFIPAQPIIHNLAIFTIYLTTLIMALNILIIFLHINWLNIFKSTKTQKIFAQFCAFLASLSFGIYLIHPQIINLMYYLDIFKFEQMHLNLYLYNLLNWSIIFFSSALIAWMISKTPYLKKIIGQ